MLRNDYTVPTRCRHRGGIVDPPCQTACRALRQPIRHPIKYLITRSNRIQTSQFAVIRSSTVIGSYTPESYYRPYTVATSGVNRLASQICHNRLFRKKLQQNFLHMISTEVSSSATHNSRNSASLCSENLLHRQQGTRIVLCLIVTQQDDSFRLLMRQIHCLGRHSASICSKNVDRRILYQRSTIRL
jgi:hypothetical protein